MVQHHLCHKHVIILLTTNNTISLLIKCVIKQNFKPPTLENFYMKEKNEPVHSCKKLTP
jgi:hypothetical protein